MVSLIALVVVSLHAQQPPPQNPEPGFRFKSGVELINVTASVSDASGRFVPGLRKEDFVVYEDGQAQAVTHFSAERVPVSLGIALDTSGSMAGERIQAAQSALDRFLYDLLAADDEIFLYRFSDRPDLVQGWTTDRQRPQQCAWPHPDGRHNGDVRRRRRSRPPRGYRAASEEGAGSAVGWQRHLQQYQPSPGETAHSRKRSARLCDRHRVRDRAIGRRSGINNSNGADRSRCRFPSRQGVGAMAESPPTAADHAAAAGSQLEPRLQRCRRPWGAYAT